MMSGLTVGTERPSTSNLTVDSGFVPSHDHFGVPRPCSPPQVLIDAQPTEINYSDSQVPLSPSTGQQTPPVIPDKTKVITSEEKLKALDQLKVLEQQIIDHKINRVDGRRTRFSRNKTTHRVKVEPPSEDPNGVSPKSSSSSITTRELKSFLRKNTHTKTENGNVLKESVERNNNEITDEMKEESTAVLSPIGATTNVLESMKQQFLQGTENVPEEAVIPPKDPKKRRPGRPKKHLPSKPLEPSSQNNNPPSSDQSPKTPSPQISPKKEGTSPLLHIDFYARKNPLTKGLRGVRKSESGSESNSSSPTKENVRISPRSPTLSTLNQNWPQSPLGASPKENGSTKCPLISAAAKTLSFPTVPSPIESKIPKTEITSSNNTNGIPSPGLPNGSSVTSEPVTNGVVNGTGSQKRGRGKRKVLGQQTPEGSAKKTVATLVVDVHNTMNGDPQTVIPPKNPIVIKKKKASKIEAPASSLSRSGKENAPNPPSVPESSDAPHLSTSQSASNSSDIPPVPSNKSTNLPSAERSSKVQKTDVAPPVLKSSLSSPPSNPDKATSAKATKRASNGTPVDKRQRTMLDFTTKPKSLDEAQIAALLPESPSVEPMVTQTKVSPTSAPKVTPSSPSKTPSPKKSPEGDETPKSKHKNKSLTDVIQKLQSPNSKDTDGDESSLPTTEVQFKQELVEVKQEPFEEATEATLVEARAVLTSPEVADEALHAEEQIKDTAVSELPLASSSDVSSQSGPKKKRQKREVENLFMDEGALNLLTSLHSGGSRRSTIAAIDEPKPRNSPALYAETVKQRLLAERKRKWSGASSTSGPTEKGDVSEAKKPRLETSASAPKTAGQPLQLKKKIGRPSNAELRRKRELMRAKALTPSHKHDQSKVTSDKAVPPLKIKLPTANLEKITTISAGEQMKPKAAAPHVNTQKMLKPGAGGRPSLPGPSGVGLSKKPTQQLLARKSLPPNVPGSQITSLLKPINGQQNTVKLKKTSGEGVRHSQRSRGRQTDGPQFRDIHLRKFKNIVQIILSPSTTQIKYALNSRVLRELCEALSLLKRDSSVKMVLLTGLGTTFCNGVDFTCLNHSNPELRTQNAINLTRSIREFLVTLVQYPKMIIAGVNGSATGLGVTMLPLFDMVYATEKAEFFLPYSILGQVPEGGATFTFPYSYGKMRANKLFMGRKMSAVEAEQMGLVSETLWNATFMQELIPKVCTLAEQPCTANESTKALVNHHLHTKLELALESENRLLVTQWTSPDFVQNVKRLLDKHHFVMQKCLNLP